MPEYYTKTIINPNNIIVETCIGNIRYYETFPRSSEEDLVLAALATKYKVLASDVLHVDDPNSAAQAVRLAKNALAPTQTDLTP